MRHDIKEKIFDKSFVNCEKAEFICQELEIKRSEFSEYAKQIDKERPLELAEMRRIRQLHNNKQGKDFELPFLCREKVSLFLF